MALTVDAATSAENSLQTSLTWSHTCTGSDLVLVVGISFYQNTNSFVSGVTYNSVAMTLIPNSSTNNGAYFSLMYGLIAPSTGANDIVVTMGGNAPFELGCGAISWTDAHQTTPFGTANTATGNSTSPSVTVSSGASEVVMANLIILHSGTLSVGAAQTSRWNEIGASGFTKYAGSTEPGDASTIMSWSNTTTQTWAITAVPIKPTAAVSAGSSSNL